jgi:hypothetical protein
LDSAALSPCVLLDPESRKTLDGNNLLRTTPSTITSVKMVCAKCQKLQGTKLATPDVKRKSDIYHGSPASSSSKSGSSSDKKSATLGQTGVGKVCTPSTSALTGSR